MTTSLLLDEVARLPRWVPTLEDPPLDFAKPKPEEGEPNTCLIKVPEWAEPWLTVKDGDGNVIRYRVAYGGRGSAKSRTIARMLVARAMAKFERILCCREFQNSIRDSSKMLLEDEINRLGVRDKFKITTTEIICLTNGSRFIFMGMHNKEQTIRSLEGVTLVWIEEAASVSQASLDALDPTIRSENSEIWVSYNPRFATDPIDKMFRGENGPPPGTLLLKVNYDQNFFFPEVLKRIMEHARETDPDKYAHVWLGEYLQNSSKKVFRNWSVQAFHTPAGAVRRFGADWGFAQDPSVLLSCFIGRWEDDGQGGRRAVEDQVNGNVLFFDHEAWGVEVQIDDHPALFAGDDTHYAPRWTNPNQHPGIPGAHKHMITADSARPEMISYMRQRAFQIRSAIKGPGSIEDGIVWMKNYEIVVHPRCPQLADEMALYSYKEDKLTGDILPELEDKHNNTIDAARYALESVRKSGGTFFHRSEGPRVSIQKIDDPTELRDRVLDMPRKKPEKPARQGFGFVPATKRGFDI